MALLAYCLLALCVGINAQWAAKPDPDPVELRKPEPHPKMEPSSNTYLLLAPRNVYPGTNLSVAVHLLVPVSSETITGTLFDRQDVEVATATITTSAQDVQLELAIPTEGITWQTYKLRLSGSGSVPFSNETYMYGRPSYVSIIGQTDKAIYKPGETVRWRVVVINRNLDPIETPLDIEIFDPKNNKIDEKIGVQNLFGVDGTLPLSDMPPLGSWRIEIKATAFQNDHQDSLTFRVKEYVLPKFEVTVSLPPYGTLDMMSLKGFVKAEYTFGKPVIGYVVLVVRRRWNSGFYDARGIETSFPINGEASFEIPMDLVNRLTRNPEYERVIVEANVTETLTGVTLAGEGSMQIYSKQYKVEFDPSLPNNFKPGYVYGVKLKVTEQDGRPPSATTEKVKVTTTYFTDKPVTVNVPGRVSLSDVEVIPPFADGETIMMETKEYLLGADGIVQFDLNPPDTTSTASIKVEYALVAAYKDISRFRSPGEIYLKVEALTTGQLKIGDELQIKLTSSEGNVVVKYIVQAKGNIVRTGEVSISGPKKEVIIKVLLGRDMTPSARIVAYYVRTDAEIVADGMNIPIEDFFENKVTVEFDTVEPSVLPQSSIDIRVKAAPDSMVHVLAVDNSVLQLGGDGNDLTLQRVTSKLSRFGNFPIVSRGWGIIAPWSFSADDATGIFDNAQLNVMTDANLFRFDLWRLDQPSLKFGSSAGGAGPRLVALEDSVQMSPGVIGASDGSEPEGQIRKDFPETWIWKSTQLNANGEAVLKETVPDTITTFNANAFALSPTQGLGVASLRSNLTVFKPFFVVMQLPYSVIRGEIAIIQANVFNYYTERQAVKVELISQTSPEFVGITIDANGNEIETTGTLEQCLLVDPDQAVPVYFSVRPIIVGSMTVTVKITSLTRNIFDQVIRQLPVEAEGLEKADNYPTLIANKEPNTATNKVDIFYPPGLVPMSERIRVTLFGDVFGPSMDNLDKLVKMPYGCGEQNMLHFAPAAFVAQYARVTGRLKSNQALEDKLKTVLKTGYQRELLYKRNDGSYSAFGNADADGSLWLTAFVVKSFAQVAALKLIYIDPNVITQGVNYILNQQLRDGTFTNTGIVHHKAMQGNTDSSEIARTAYIIIALNEVQKSLILTDATTISRLETALTSAGSFLLSKLREMSTDYEAAIGAWALKVLGKTEYSKLLQYLNSSENKTKEGVWKEESAALEVEIVGYVLQVFSDIPDLDQGLVLLKWLVKKRSPYGGFISTQDTVVALQALASYASLIYSSEVDMTVLLSTIKTGQESSRTTLTLTSENHDTLQYVDFPGDVESVVVTASGVGLAIVEAQVFYNVIQEAEPPSYSLTLTVVEDLTNRYTVRVCASYDKPNSKSNMAIMDIGGVSGYVALKDAVETSPLIKRLEAPGGRLIIYFDEIPAELQCVSVPFQRVTLVANVKEATVVVYSYYEPDERVMGSYLPEKLRTVGLCNTCGAECGCGPLPGGATPVTCENITATVANPTQSKDKGPKKEKKTKEKSKGRKGEKGGKFKEKNKSDRREQRLERRRQRNHRG